jgi:hypothetical protein
MALGARSPTVSPSASAKAGGAGCRSGSLRNRGRVRGLSTSIRRHGPPAVRAVWRCYRGLRAILKVVAVVTMGGSTSTVPGVIGV